MEYFLLYHTDNKGEDFPIQEGEIIGLFVDWDKMFNHIFTLEDKNILMYTWQIVEVLG